MKKQLIIEERIGNTGSLFYATRILSFIAYCVGVGKYYDNGKHIYIFGKNDDLYVEQCDAVIVENGNEEQVIVNSFDFETNPKSEKLGKILLKVNRSVLDFINEEDISPSDEEEVKAIKLLIAIFDDENDTDFEGEENETED